MAIVLGTNVTDSLTGFKGTAFARAEFLYGCVKIGVHPVTLDPDGNLRPLEFFDEARLVENDPATTPAPSALLGEPVEDLIIGYKGIVTAYSTYLYAGPRVSVQRPGFDKHGQPHDAMDFDVGQLKGYRAGKLFKGGPAPMARPHAVARRV